MNPQEPRSRQDVSLGQVALRRKMITGPQLVEAIMVQLSSTPPKPLGEVLVERGFIRGDTLKELLSLQHASQKLSRLTLEEELEGARADANIGQTIGDTAILERIAHQEMWSIYKGFDKALKQHVAMKIIPTAAFRKGLWMDFLETVRACMKFESPNVVRVIDTGRHSGNLFIKTTYVDGIDLAALLAGVRRIKVAEGVRIAREIARGLRDAHKKDILHRDVKPENVLIAKTGGVQITDFGLVFEPLGSKRVMKSGQKLYGTPATIAPELARGDYADAKSDVYSLGVCLYYMLTGARPFEGQSLSDLLQQIQEAAPLPPAKYFPEVSAEISDLVLRTLSKERDKRPSSEELVGQLDKIVEELASRQTRRIDSSRLPRPA